VRLRGGDILIYGELDEALSDCREGEQVWSCTGLPEELQKEIIESL
jgi:hypothetical protein